MATAFSALLALAIVGVHADLSITNFANERSSFVRWSVLPSSFSSSWLNLTQLQDPPSDNYDQYGSVWYGATADGTNTRKQFLLTGFDTSFTFRITPTSPTSRGEGFTFGIFNAHSMTTVRGTDTGGLGYGDKKLGTSTPVLVNSVVIEFDIRQQADLNDPAFDHVSIHAIPLSNTSSEVRNSPDENAASIGSAQIPFALDDDVVHRARVTWIPAEGSDVGPLQVFIDSDTALLTIANFRLSDYVYLLEDFGGSPLYYGQAWMGFTGATGEMASPSISTVSITSWNVFDGNSTVLADQSFASGAAVMNPAQDAGVPISFLVQLVNDYGWNYTKALRPGTTWEVTLTSTDGVETVPVNVVDNRNGTLTATYTPVRPKTHTVNFALNNGTGAIPLHNSPFNVNFVVGVPNAGVTNATGSGLTLARAGDPGALTLYLRDVMGNLQSTGGLHNQFKISLSSASTGAECSGTVSPSSTGTYSATYACTKAANDYVLSITFADVDISGSPFNGVSVVPAVASGPHSFFSGPGSEGDIVAGKAGVLNLQLNDRFSNPITDGSALGGIIVFLVQNGPVDPLTVDAVITIGQEGNYTATWNATVAELYSCNLQVNGDAIPGSGFLVEIVPDKAFAPRSVAYGDSLVSARAGNYVTFTLYAMDRFGNNVTDGLAPVLATLRSVSDQVVHVDMTNNNDGTYSFGYNADYANSYQLALKLEGVNVKNSPFTVTIRANLTISPVQTMSDQLAGGVVFKAGDPSDFAIIARDFIGNQLDIGGNADRFMAIFSVGGQNVTLATITDPNTGIYIGKIDAEQLQRAGQYLVYITYDGVGIARSPYTLTVTPADLSPRDCLLNTLPSTNITAGTQASFSVTGYDRFLNLVVGTDSTFYAVVLGGGPRGRPAIGTVIRTPTNGVYSGNFVQTVSSSDAYRLEVRVENSTGTLIRGSPQSLFVSAGPPRPEGSTFDWTDGTVLEAGVNGTFKVQVCDAFGNPLTVRPTNPTWTGALVFTPSDGRPVADPLVDNNDGTFTARFNLETAGTYAMQVRMVQGTLPPVLIDNGNSKAVVVIAGAASPSTTLAEGPGLITAVAGAEATFTVQTFDAFGNPRTSGGTTFEATISPPGPGLYLTYTDLLNGNYTFRYNATAAGTRTTLTVAINERNIIGSPFTPAITPELAPSSLSTVVYPTEGGVAGANTTFQLTALDRFGNSIGVGGGAAAIRVSLSAPQDAWDSHVQDNGNGIYRLSYVCRLAGPVTVSVLVNNVVVQQGTADLTIVPDVLSPATSTATGTGLRGGSRASNLTFSVQARDQFGNQLLTTPAATVTGVLTPTSGSGEQFRAQCTASATPAVFTCAYTVTVIADYTLSVQVNSVDVVDSPFAVRIVRGVPSAAQTTATGAGLVTAVAGNPAKFTVTVRDEAGNQLPEQGNEVTATMANPNVPVACAETDSYGVFECTYTATVAASYQISVFVRVESGPAPIQNSPFTTTVTPAAISAASSTTDATLTAGSNQPYSFNILAADRFGNRVPATQDERSNWSTFIRQDPDLGVQGTISVGGSGSFVASYDALGEPGAYTLLIRYRQTDIPGSPFAFTITDSSPASGAPLSAGAIGGIAAGGAVLLIVLIFFFCRRKRRAAGSDDNYFARFHNPEDTRVRI